MASADGKKKWYPHLVKHKRAVNSVRLAAEIADRSSLTPGDVYNVIQNLFDSMQKHLANSETVKLEGIGTFTMKAHSEGNGVDSPDEVHHSQINHLTVQFTPEYRRLPGANGGVVRPMFNGLEFVKLDIKK